MTPELLRPLVEVWTEKLRLARQEKKAFDEVADQCMSFFSGTMGFLWKEDFRQRFLGGVESPKFLLTIAKAFELVAIFGPVLYNRNPVRVVRPIEPLEFGPEVFGDPNDQQVQQFFGQLQQGQAVDYARARLRCQLQERYLSYTPREQPDGGLQQAAEDAITEALIKGCGFLQPQVYTFPGTQRRLTGCFYTSPDRVLFDPDAKSFRFGDARWMAVEADEPVWQVSQRTGIPKEKLRGSYESGDSKALSKVDYWSNRKRQSGESYDRVRYWKVWSIAGVGTRLSSQQGSAILGELEQDFDRLLGDYCYLEIYPGYAAPLNCPLDVLTTADDEQIKRRFQWPIPYWIDRRWPLAALYFYRAPNSLWPLATMAAGLGELTALNIIICALVERVYDSSQEIIAVLKSNAEAVEKVLKSVSYPKVLHLADRFEDINKVVSILQRPPANVDVWKIIDALFSLWEKRVGLNELLYGLNPGDTASRSATDIQAKQRNLSVRPDHMAQKVEAWMGEAARMERLCAYWAGISGNDVLPVLGRSGAVLWQQLVETEDPEVVIRESSCTIEANSVRKPNKDKEIANIKDALPFLAPELSKHADATGDTGPLNGLIHTYAQRIDDSDLAKVRMGPRTPPAPPPEVLQQQQATQQAEAQKAADEVQARREEHAAKMEEAGMEVQARRMEMAHRGMETVQEMQHAEAQHRQALRHQGEKQKVDLAAQRAQARLKRLAPTGNGRG